MRIWKLGKKNYESHYESTFTTPAPGLSQHRKHKTDWQAAIESVTLSWTVTGKPTRESSGFTTSMTFGLLTDREWTIQEVEELTEYPISRLFSEFLNIFLSDVKLSN